MDVHARARTHTGTYAEHGEKREKGFKGEKSLTVRVASFPWWTGGRGFGAWVAPCRRCGGHGASELLDALPACVRHCTAAISI